jgi:hypothetical protein
MTSHPLQLPRGDGVGTKGIGWVDSSASGRYQIKLTTRHAILVAPLEAMSERMAACCSLCRHARVLTLHGFSARRASRRAKRVAPAARVPRACDLPAPSPHRSSIVLARLSSRARFCTATAILAVTTLASGTPAHASVFTLPPCRSRPFETRKRPTRVSTGLSATTPPSSTFSHDARDGQQSLRAALHLLPVRGRLIAHTCACQNPE